MKLKRRTRRLFATLIVLLLFVHEFHHAMLAFALTNSLVNAPLTAGKEGSIEFLRKQLEEATPPEDPGVERRYIIPKIMSLSEADRVWASIAPFISLGYDSDRLIEALDGLGLPREIKANNVTALIDYSNLRIARHMENGEVSVEIPLTCDKPLPSIHYEITGIKKSVKLFNVTITRLYEVSVNASELFNVAYMGSTGKPSKAVLNLSNFETYRVQAYLSGLKNPASSEILISLLSYGITVSLKPLEHRVFKDCHWIRINGSIRSFGISGGVLSIRHSGGWILRPWFLPQDNEYAFESWVRWDEGDELTVRIGFGGFEVTFNLVFGTPSGVTSEILNRILSEGKLRRLLNQPQGGLNLSRVLKGWRVRLVDEKATNETVWLATREYGRIMEAGWSIGNSFFTDSGEAEWKYVVSNRTIGESKSIKLLYNPLRVKRGELAHGLTIKNYADSNVSYTLRLRTSTNYFLFFSDTKEGNGSIIVGKQATSMMLVQKEPAFGEAILELVKDGRVVSAVKVSLALKAAWFWKGFWDGLASKLPGIMITAGVMVVIGFLIPNAYVRPAYYLLLGVGIVTNLLDVAVDIAEAQKARDEMLSFASAMENRSIEFLANGDVEHAVECKSLASMLRREVNETMGDLALNILSNLAIGISIDEVRIALGLKEPLATNELERQYKIGYARGRVTGTVISCVLYVALFTLVNRIKAERIGQHLTTKQILSTIAKGLYNWITPSVWDATLLAIQRKGTKFFGNIIDLLLGNKYSKFGDVVGGLIDRIRASLGTPEIGDFLESLSRLCKQVVENVPSKESSSKILNVISVFLEKCSIDEVEEKGGTVVRSITSIWAKDGDDGIDKLNEWLNANPDKAKEFVDKILLAIKGDASRGVGLKIGDIADNYFNIKSKYGEEVAGAFLNTILRNPDVLTDVSTGMSSFDFGKELHRIMLKRGTWGTLDIGESNKVKLGTYVVRVYWEYDSGDGKKSGIVRFSLKKDVESSQINIPKGQVDQILGRIGSNEAQVFITKVELFDYRLFFPTEFFVSDKRIRLDLFNNEMEISGMHYKFSTDQDVYGGKIRVDAKLEGKNIKGKNLVLSFYQDSKVRIKYGEESRSIKEIEVDATMVLMKVEYLKSEGGEEHMAEYSFNSKPLDAQMGRVSCEIVVEGQKRVKLKE